MASQISNTLFGLIDIVGIKKNGYPINYKIHLIFGYSSVALLNYITTNLQLLFIEIKNVTS